MWIGLVFAFLVVVNFDILAFDVSFDSDAPFIFDVLS